MHDAGGCARGVDLVHGVGGNGQQDLRTSVEIRLAEDVDGLVDAVGEEGLRGGEAEVLGDVALHGLTPGVAREVTAANAAQRVEHARRTGKSVLVEVEAQT